MNSGSLQGFLSYKVDVASIPSENYQAPEEDVYIREREREL